MAHRVFKAFKVLPFKAHRERKAHKELSDRKAFRAFKVQELKVPLAHKVRMDHKAHKVCKV